MNNRYHLSVVLLIALLICSGCSKDIDAPVLPEHQGAELPQGTTLSADQLFGVWGATASYGNTAVSHFEQRYEVSFQSVEDGDAVFSHWFTNASSEITDSVVGVEYTYVFNGTTIEMTPKTAAAARGIGEMKAVHIGNNQLVLFSAHDGKTDTICTLRRLGDPVPSITGVDRTLPQIGETVTVTGRNLQFVDHVFLPTADGEKEVTDFQKTSKQITFIVPTGDYAAGSIRCQSTTAHESCYSPAYMFCYDCVYFHNFSRWGTSAPYAGTEFEYSIKSMGSIISKSTALDSSKLPAGHCLADATEVVNPDSLLSIFGNTPIAWPVSSKTDNTGSGYIRFSSGDRFQYVLDHCNGLLTNRTPCTEAAIQMDVYVWSDGKPEWSTGYVQYRLNKDQNSLTSAWVASVAPWEKDAPVSFANGWQTFTIPLTAFSAAASLPSLGELVSRLKASNYQSILTVVNYPMDAAHPAQALSSFQFNIANIRLVPYKKISNPTE